MISELEGYLQVIEDLRGQVGELIVDLPSEALNWRPIEGSRMHSTNSLAVLATHVAGAEHFWIGEVVGGLPPTRERDAEFGVVALEASQLVDLLQDTGVETREVFSALGATDLEDVRQVRGREVPVQWCILHVIDHSALHLGHMQLTLQLWQGGRSGPSPRGFERLDAGD